jgi:hypothetical protein
MGYIYFIIKSITIMERRDEEVNKDMNIKINKI